MTSSFHLLNIAKAYEKKSVKDKPHTWQLHSKDRGNYLNTRSNNLAKDMRLVIRRRCHETIIFPFFPQKENIVSISLLCSAVSRV